MGHGEARDVRIDLLGPLRVQIGGVDVDVGGPKVQSVLVTLAHHLGANWPHGNRAALQRSTTCSRQLLDQPVPRAVDDEQVGCVVDDLPEFL